MATAVADAAEAVSQAGLDDPGWALEAFKILLSSRVAGATAPALPVPPQHRPPDAFASGPGGPGGQRAEGIGPLAARLGVDEDGLADIFGVNREGRVEIHVATPLLTKAKSGATKELALLVLASEQYVGDAWTSVESVRKVVADYGKYDASNFTSSLRQLGTAATVRGKQSSAEYRLTRVGWEAAAVLVRRLAGTVA
jgi:hypothetical protein